MIYENWVRNECGCTLHFNLGTISDGKVEITNFNFEYCDDHANAAAIIQIAQDSIFLNNMFVKMINDPEYKEHRLPVEEAHARLFRLNTMVNYLNSGGAYHVQFEGIDDPTKHTEWLGSPPKVDVMKGWFE